MNQIDSTSPVRILILCVDRDGDLTAKTQVKTPVTGRNENINAAVALALQDPEEPDANAIFEAVRIYDQLKSENKSNEALEIASISGSELGDVTADRKIVAELNELLTAFSATEVVLVTDGYTDEAVLPLIESRVPVSSVRRIIIKHSESIEETAALFSRYVRMLVENPRYSRIALGIPGILLVILGALTMLNLLSIFWIVSLFLVGAFLLIKGFGVDKQVERGYMWIKEYSPPPLPRQISNFAAIAGLLSVTLGAYGGWTNAVSNINPPQNLAAWLSILPQAIGYFIKGSMDLIVIGFCVILFGRAVRMYFERDVRLLRNAVLIVSIGWSRQILDGASDVLLPNGGYDKLIFSIIIGIMMGVASVLVAFIIHRSSKEFFDKTRGEIEQLTKPNNSSPKQEA
jgi:putative membrane protein